MAMVRPKGPLADLGIEEGCEHASACDRQAVVRVDDPAQITSAGLSLCPYHLALWLDERDLEPDPEISRLAESDALLELSDAPPWTQHGGEYWSRLGIDHLGEAHYYTELDDDHEDTARILIVDKRLDVQDAKRVPGHKSIGDWIAYVREERGWMRLDPDVVRAYEVGEE